MFKTSKYVPDQKADEYGQLVATGRRSFVFVADLHLSPVIWAEQPEIAGDAYESLQQIDRHLEANAGSATWVILGGDIFDKTPTPQCMYEYLHFVASVSRFSGMSAIQGQHGRSSTLPWTSVCSQVGKLHGQKIKLFGEQRAGRGMGFDRMPAAELEKALAEVPEDVSVLFLHQMAKGCVPDIRGEAQPWDLDPEWVPAHVKLVLMGDLHKAIEFTNSRGTRFVYSGSISQRSIDEPTKKSFIRVYEDLTYKRIALKTREFSRELIRNEQELTAFIEKLPSYEEQSVVEIRYEPSVEGLENRVREAVSKLNPAIFLRFSLLRFGTLLNEQAPVRPSDVSLESCLSMVVDRVREPAEFGFIKALVEARGPEVSGVVSDWKKKVTGK